MLDRETIVQPCGCVEFWVRDWNGIVRIIPTTKCPEHSPVIAVKK